MRCALPVKLAILLLPIGVASGCASLGSSGMTPRSAVALPAPLSFMGGCPASRAAAGMPPNEGFDAEHAALKDCSRRGAASRAWYLGVRKRYGEAKR